MRIKQLRTFFIFPICLLFFNVLEELFVYQLRKAIPNDYIYTAVLVIMFVICFGFIGNWLAPHINKVIENGHKKSKKTAGRGGIITFFLILFALIYVLYFIIYCKGPQFLLPAAVELGSKV